MKALPAPGTANKGIEVLCLIVVRTPLGRGLEMGFDNILDINQNGGGPLLAVFVNDDAKAVRIAPLHGGLYAASRCLAANLVSADGLKFDRLTHM
ncbi:MAG: hypothetical protein ACOVOD_11440, partial [Rhodoferax sp.]